MNYKYLIYFLDTRQDKPILRDNINGLFTRHADLGVCVIVNLQRNERYYLGKWEKILLTKMKDKTTRTIGGYYWVKFYNHKDERILYWNGEGFESFSGDRVNDEIEKVDENRIVK